MIPKKKRQRYKIAAVTLSKLINQNLNVNSWEDIWSLLNSYGNSYYEVKKAITAMNNNKNNEHLYKYSKAST